MRIDNLFEFFLKTPSRSTEIVDFLEVDDLFKTPSRSTEVVNFLEVDDLFKTPSRSTEVVNFLKVRLRMPQLIPPKVCESINFIKQGAFQRAEASDDSLFSWIEVESWSSRHRPMNPIEDRVLRENTKLIIIGKWRHICVNTDLGDSEVDTCPGSWPAGFWHLKFR